MRRRLPTAAVLLTPVSFHELRLARAFKPIAVYWVGRSFQGKPLTAVDDGSDYEAVNGMNAYYGDCEQSAFGQGCTLPLQITSVIYTPHSNADLAPYAKLQIRGVPAIAWNHGRQIEVYTSYLAIDITADTPRRALAAAQQLEPLNEPAPLVAGDLPPPSYTPGLRVDPPAQTLANALRALPATDTTLSIARPGMPRP
jgi:hypothetical protein